MFNIFSYKNSINTYK